MNTQGSQPKWLFPIAAVVVYGGIAGVFGYHGYQHFFGQHHGQGSGVVKAQPCTFSHATVSATLTDSGWQPSPVEVRRCDLVTIINQSSKGIRPALGPHDAHVQYPTFKETDLHIGESVQFQAQAIGTFELHDHVRDEEATETELIVTE